MSDDAKTKRPQTQAEHSRRWMDLMQEKARQGVHPHEAVQQIQESDEYWKTPFGHHPNGPGK